MIASIGATSAPQNPHGASCDGVEEDLFIARIVYRIWSVATPSPRRPGDRGGFGYTVLVKIVAFVAALTALVVVLGAALYRVGGADGEGPAAAVESDQPPDAQLSQRLAIAYGALRSAEGTRRLQEVHRYAAVAIDAIAGPTGRHGRDTAPAGGILPEDAAQVRSEPGLALRT